MAPMRKYITSSSFSAFASAARKLFSNVASPPPAELMTLSIWSTSGKSNSHFCLLPKTDLTSLLDEPENPECDCAAQKHSNHPTNDGVHNPSSEKAEEKGDDKREDERHETHLGKLGSALLKVAHHLLDKVRSPDVAEQTPSCSNLVCDSVRNASGEKVFAEKERL